MCATLTKIQTPMRPNGAHGGCDRSAGDAHSSAAPDPAFAFVGGTCCPTLEFVIALWIMITFYTLLPSLFCICHYKNTSVHLKYNF